MTFKEGEIENNDLLPVQVAVDHDKAEDVEKSTGQTNYNFS